MEPPNMLTRAIWDVPIGTKLPDLKSFQLTKEMVKHRAKDNVIVVTFGNYAFMDFILNWVKHLTDLNVFNLLVGAMDMKLLEAFHRKGIPVFDMGSKMATIDVGWGSTTFHKMGREQVLLINALLAFGYELQMCDTDMVWLKNPLSYIVRFPKADILTSTDQIVRTVTDDSLELWQQELLPCITKKVEARKLSSDIATSLEELYYSYRNATLAKLQRFKKSLSTKLSAPSSNGSKDTNEEDDSGWMATQLKFIPESSDKDGMTRKDEPNEYVVHDPLLEKGKEKFNRMQA